MSPRLILILGCRQAGDMIKATKPEEIDDAFARVIQATNEKMNRTLSPEMDAWLARQPVAVPPAAAKKGDVFNPVPPCPLDDAAFAWLWERYQQCSFPPATAYKRLARTPLANLSLRGRNFACRAAFRFRRQILGKSAVKMTELEFLSAVRSAALSKR